MTEREKALGMDAGWIEGEDGDGREK